MIVSKITGYRVEEITDRKEKWNMRKLHAVEQVKEATGAPKPCVLVFKAEWCGDCRFIEPFMPEVEAAYADELDFCEVDRDELPKLAEELGILGIPSFVVFKEGREVVRFVSKLRKTREEIEAFLDRAVQVAKALPPATGG